MSIGFFILFAAVFAGFLAFMNILMSRGKFEPKGFILVVGYGLATGLPTAYAVMLQGKADLLVYALVAVPLALPFLLMETVSIFKGRGPRSRSICGMLGLAGMILVPFFPMEFILVPIAFGLAGIGIFLAFHFRYPGLNPMWLSALVVEAAAQIPKNCGYSAKPITVFIPSKISFRSGTFGCSVYVRKDRTTVWMKRRFHIRLGRPNLDLLAHRISEMIQGGAEARYQKGMDGPSKTGSAALALALFLAFQAPPAAANEYSFDRVFPSFESREAAENAERTDPEGKDTSLRLGNFYFIKGTAPETPQAMKREYVAKAIAALEKIWKKDRKDNEVCLSLGYAYTARAGITSMSELESLLADINRAQNLFGMVAARLPKNIDARLARTMINMNLSAQNGRPDALILEDYDVYIEGYSRLSEDFKANPYYLMGAAEMALAKALVLKDRGQRAEAKTLAGKIDGSILPEQFRKMLDTLKKELK